MGSQTGVWRKNKHGAREDTPHSGDRCKTEALIRTAVKVRGAGAAEEGRARGARQAAVWAREGGRHRASRRKTISVTPVLPAPASAQATGPGVRVEPLTCASWQLPLPKGGVDPDSGRGFGAGQAGALAREGPGRARPRSSPARRPRTCHASAPSRSKPLPILRAKARAGGPSLPHPEDPVGRFGERGRQGRGAAECSGGPRPLVPKSRQRGPRGPGEASSRG